MYTSITELGHASASVLTLEGPHAAITDEDLLRSRLIDRLVVTAVFAPDAEVKAHARALIRRCADALHIWCASLHAYYLAIGRGEVPATSTVPAINVRTLTYDLARTIFQVQMEYRVGPVIFELARSEMLYTDQTPDEYVTVVLAAAIKAGYRGPIFIQGDHFQVNAAHFFADPDAELDALRQLIAVSLMVGFHNIDLDASTLVNLVAPTLAEGQAENIRQTALLSEYIRAREPAGMTTSIGAEIGHIGGRNSTPEDVRVFMDGYLRSRANERTPGTSKLSVQTGTSHGGIPLPDGQIARVRLDLAALEATGHVARGHYHLGGVVQHGASTLPTELFGELPRHHTLEIHLATGFQNLVYDHLPEALREEMYAWLEARFADERAPDQSREQFLYTQRKKALGPFKRELWALSASEKAPMLAALAELFRFLFTALNVRDTQVVLGRFITPPHR
jgi:hypothetical protein